MERIGIFCADESELEPFLRRLEREEVRQAVMLPFTLGRLEGCPVALVAGGVGKSQCGHCRPAAYFPVRRQSCH